MNQRRFSIPNDIWKWNLKPQGFATLAYLCYLHIHCNKGASSSADEIASQLHMSKDMAAEQLSELNHRGLLDQHMVPVFKNTSKNFFSLPNELFFLNIGHGVITVYAYLLYCEDRRTHQCHPSYRTISDVVHLTVSTVMKHITKLADRQFITVESTSYPGTASGRSSQPSPIRSSNRRCSTSMSRSLKAGTNWCGRPGRPCWNCPGR